MYSKPLKKWYCKTSWIIIHGVFCLLSALVALGGLFLGIGRGIAPNTRGSNEGDILIPMMLFGGIFLALYCFIMFLIGLFKNNRNSSKGSIIILRSLAVISMLGSLRFVDGIFFFFSRLSDMTILDSVFIFSSLGTFFGAILMFFKKKKGLYIYSLFQLTHIISIILSYNFDLFTLLGSFFPAVLFLLLYWSKQIRENLT
jgi:hypothetical protein